MVHQSCSAAAEASYANPTSQNMASPPAQRHHNYTGVLAHARRPAQSTGLYLWILYRQNMQRLSTDSPHN